MKLLWSRNSPYARKLRVIIRERGLAQRVAEEAVDLADPKNTLHKINPLGKIPALVLDDGRVIVDSPVIAEYLDQLHDGAKIVPPAGDARWRALTLQALADGLTDATVLGYQESQRPAGEKSKTVEERHKLKAQRTLDELETRVSELDGPLDIAQIAVVAALGYMVFRLGTSAMGTTRPRLAAWYQRIAERPSFAATAPGP